MPSFFAASASLKSPSSLTYPEYWISIATTAGAFEGSSEGSSDGSSDGSSNDSSNNSSSDPATEEPEVPGDYQKVIWGKTYNGKKVYIVGIDNEDFMVWVNGDWIPIYAEYDDGEVNILYMDETGTVYYVQNTRLN